MPRQLEIRYPGAFHVMARGNGRQDIVHDDLDRDRLMGDLAGPLRRSSWQVYAFVVLSNHLHIVVKTPSPTSRGECKGSSHPTLTLRHDAAALAGACSRDGIAPSWWKTRVTSGRCRGTCAFSPGSPGLVGRPGRPGGGRVIRAMPIGGGDWSGSGACGLLKCWAGEFGGSDPAAAYRRYVTAGLTEPPPCPWSAAHHGWVLGSGPSS